MASSGTDRDMWHWYHNVSECYYHIQITVKYRRSVLSEQVQTIIKETLKEFSERYAIEISNQGRAKDIPQLTLFEF